MALDQRFDSRLIERNLRKGIITREEYDAYISDLKDNEKNAVTIQLEQPLFHKPEEDADGDD